MLVVTKGHPFDQGAFHAMLEAVLEMARPLFDGGYEWTHVEQPAAQVLLAPEHVAQYDAVLFYDLPGLWFRVPEPPRFVEPSEGFKASMEAMLDAGMPLLFMHHALAGWPAWPRYAEIVGGRFHYQPDPATGRPDDGYRHACEHFVRVVAEHPVTAGLGEGFHVRDELYLVTIDESDKLPLLRSNFRFDPAGFYSAAAALEGRMHTNEGWSHPPGSDLVAWAKTAGHSPVVYLQCGDGPDAFANPGVRRVLGNALDWLTSGAARRWAQTFLAR